MHRDTKLGLALGVLLVGVVGALFFRNDRDPLETAPRLETAQALDATIAEKAITPYLTGIEPEPSPPAQLEQRIVAAPNPADWEIPDFLRDESIREYEQRLAGVTLGPPDPIQPSAPIAQTAPPIPQQRTWEPFEADRASVGKAAPRIAPVSRPVARSQPIVAAPIASWPETPAQEGPVWHVVKEGETLSGIAAYYLGSGGRFEEVYQANRDQLQSPHDMRAGMKLRIPQAAAKPSSAPITAPTPRKSIVVDPVSIDAGPATLEGIETAPPTQGTSVTAPLPQQSAPAPANDGAQRRFVPARRSPLSPWRLNGRASLDDDFEAPRKRMSQAPPEDLPAIRPNFDFGLNEGTDAAAMADQQVETPRLPVTASSETQVDEAKTSRQ